MNDSILTLTHATERDIDLLVVEELSCGEDLLRMLFRTVLNRDLDRAGYRSHQVIHSRRRVHNRREIDICVEIDLGGSRPAMLLIENKLDASEQVDQGVSYGEEAAFLVASDRAVQVWTILMCPVSYVAANERFAAEFDGVAHYEDVRDFLNIRALGLNGELAMRISYRSGLIDQAITKSRRGYVAVPLAAISDFNARYVTVVREKYPSLAPGPAMLKDGSPGESKTMIFGPQTLPNWDFLPQMRLVHQLREANANLCFYGWGDHFSELAGAIGLTLKGTGFKLQPTINRRKAGKAGLMVIATTPTIDNVTGFDAQYAQILEGMAAAERLRLWLLDHQSDAREWASQVPA